MRLLISDEVAHQNKFLKSLPDEIYNNLRPHLRLIDFSAGQVLYASNESPQFLYFPLNTVVYMFTIMKSGATVQIGTVGIESILGISLLTGGKSFDYHSMIPSSGQAISIEVGVAKREFDRSENFRQIVLFYNNFYYAQLIQDVACNRLHSLKMRLSRWLLICHDNLGSKTLKVTQEFIARMLGAQRPYITDSIGRLEVEGIVKRRRGQIEILDLQGLENNSCECYELYRQEYQNLQNNLTMLK